MKIATTKVRILQFIDYKCISKALFFEKTGIKRGFLDSDKLNQAVSDDHITKIIANYPEISIEWLLTGKGEMIRGTATNKIKEDKVPYNLDYKEKNYILLEENRDLRIRLEEKDKEIQKKTNQIQELKETTEKLKEKIDLFQKEAIKSKELKNRSKVPPFKLPNSSECVQ